MNLKDEKFLAGLKAAIESGVGEDWGFDGEDECRFDTFDIDESLSAVVKFLEENPVTGLIDKDPDLFYMKHKLYQSQDDYGYVLIKENDLVKIISDYNLPSWTPIEEFELVPGEKYDIFYFDPAWKAPGHRMPDMIYQPGEFITCNHIPMCYSASKVTHIMKRPADPEN